MGTGDIVIVVITVLISMFILVFLINWQHFNEWVVVYLLQTLLDLCLDNIAVSKHLLVYPQRLLPEYFQSNLLFDFSLFPIVCIWYNQITREKRPVSICLYSVLFSAVMTLIEIPIERWTDLLEYIRWNSFTTFYSLLGTLLLSRLFMTFYRWGSKRFGNGYSW